MKKLFSIVIGMFLLFGMIFPLLPKVEVDKTSAFVSELDILEKKDIVPIHKDQMDFDFKAYAKDGQTPFDTTTFAPMEGASITPSTIENNQVSNVSFGISHITMDMGKSIYLWVYFPDAPYENYYSFDVSFENRLGDKIYWHFTPYELYEMLETFNGERYGWKFLELCYSDAKIDGNIDENTELIKFTINYKYYSEDNEFDFANNFKYITNDTLSFYHVYVGNTSSESSSVLLHTSYVNYSIKSEFINEFNNLCLGDFYKIKTKSEIFNYIYIGKTDFLLVSKNNNKFEYVLAITDQKERHDILEGDNGFELLVSGQNEFSIVINETRASRLYSAGVKTSKVLSYKKVFYIYNYVFGTFSTGYLEIDGNKDYVLNFKCSYNFEKTGDIEFYSSNEKMLKVTSVTYNEAKNEYRITIQGIKNGRANIFASASGRRIGDKEIKEHAAYCSLEISGAKDTSSFKGMILMFVAAYAILSLIFALFTLKSIRKHRELQKGK